MCQFRPDVDQNNGLEELFKNSFRRSTEPVTVAKGCPVFDMTEFVRAQFHNMQTN